MTLHPCTVGIYSKYDIVRQGLVALLSKHPDKVCIVSIPTPPGHPDPEVVLYDVIALLDGDTRTLAYLVDETTSKVLAVGRDLRPDLGAKALRAGVDGFFDIGVNERELLRAIESAAPGCEDESSAADPTFGSSFADERDQRLGSELGLTAREVEILSLIGQGISNDEIASQTFLSINSVKTFVRRAYRKIDAHNRAEAVRWAIRHGLS